jgi:hypothetical protein
VSTTPAVNPNVQAIADQAKHAYAEGTKLLAETQYRLAELAGTGQLDRDASTSLQMDLVFIWECLGYGTVDAVRALRANKSPWEDVAWEEDDNIYSDGREVMAQARIEPAETSESSWEHNGFKVAEGPTEVHPRGTICSISSPNPKDDQVDPDERREVPAAWLRLVRVWLALREEMDDTVEEAPQQLDSFLKYLRGWLDSGSGLAAVRAPQQVDGFRKLLRPWLVLRDEMDAAAGDSPQVLDFFINYLRGWLDRHEANGCR